MPLYEFICEDCGEIFEELVISAASSNQVTCPSCNSDLVRKLISTFSAKVSGSGFQLSGFGSGRSCNTQST
jgi:putative FmdB family regulatory protein